MDEKDDEFIQMKEFTKNLIKFYIKEKLAKNDLNKEEKKEKETLFKRCNDYVDNKKNKCSLLNNIEILDIKKGNKLKKGIGIFMFILFGISFLYGIGFLWS